eukprot:g75827.t1
MDDEFVAYVSNKLSCSLLTLDLILLVLVIHRFSRQKHLSPIHHAFASIFTADMTMVVHMLPAEYYRAITGKYPSGVWCQINALIVLSYCFAEFSFVLLTSFVARAQLTPALGRPAGSFAALLEHSMGSSKAVVNRWVAISWLGAIAVSFYYYFQGYLGLYKGLYCCLPTYSYLPSSLPFCLWWAVCFAGIVSNFRQLDRTLHQISTLSISSQKPFKASQDRAHHYSPPSPSHTAHFSNEKNSHTMNGNHSMNGTMNGVDHNHNHIEVVQPTNSKVPYGRHATPSVYPIPPYVLGNPRINARPGVMAMLQSALPLSASSSVSNGTSAANDGAALTNPQPQSTVLTMRILVRRLAQVYMLSWMPVAVIAMLQMLGFETPMWLDALSIFTLKIQPTLNSLLAVTIPCGSAGSRSRSPKALSDMETLMACRPDLEQPLLPKNAPPAIDLRSSWPVQPKLQSSSTMQQSVSSESRDKDTQGPSHGIKPIFASGALQYQKELLQRYHYAGLHTQRKPYLTGVGSSASGGSSGRSGSRNSGATAGNSDRSNASSSPGTDDSATLSKRLAKLLDGGYVVHVSVGQETGNVWLPTLSIPALLEAVSVAFPSATGAHTLSYIDDEGDAVTLVSDRELAEAYELMSGSSQRRLQFVLSPAIFSPVTSEAQEPVGMSEVRSELRDVPVLSEVKDVIEE